MPLLISREPVLWDTLRRLAVSRMETRFLYRVSMSRRSESARCRNARRRRGEAGFSVVLFGIEDGFD